ncbi:MAG TPA: hypothetical protein VGF28_09635 [Thermoanaerobaculia bacterium]
MLLLTAACSRETPAPPPAPVPAASQPPAAASAPVKPAPVIKGTYEEALVWLRSTPGFRFEIEEGGVRAEGRMTRKTIGAESIEVRANGEEWRASSGPQGVAWERRSGGKWTPAPAPPYGNRLYQRVTLAFDPQKKEGAAQLAGTEGSSNRYQFTNANTGELHEVWVAQSDSHIERIRIGSTMEMKITP